MPGTDTRSKARSGGLLSPAGSPGGGRRDGGRRDGGGGSKDKRKGLLGGLFGGSGSSGGGKDKSKDKGKKKDKVNGLLDGLSGGDKGNDKSKDKGKKKDKGKNKGRGTTHGTEDPRDEPRIEDSTRYDEGVPRRELPEATDDTPPEETDMLRDKKASAPSRKDAAAASPQLSGPMAAAATELTKLMKTGAMGTAVERDAYLKDIAEMKRVIAEAEAKIVAQRMTEEWADTDTAESFQKQSQMGMQASQGILNAIAGVRRRNAAKYEHLENPGRGNNRYGWDVKSNEQ